MVQMCSTFCINNALSLACLHPIPSVVASTLSWADSLAQRWALICAGSYPVRQQFIDAGQVAACGLHNSQQLTSAGLLCSFPRQTWRVICAGSGMVCICPGGQLTPIGPSPSRFEMIPKPKTQEGLSYFGILMPIIRLQLLIHKCTGFNPFAVEQGRPARLNKPPAYAMLHVVQHLGTRQWKLQA